IVFIFSIHFPKLVSSISLGHLQLGIWGFNNSLDPVTFLYELSSYVRSIFIDQRHDNTLNEESQYFFGLPNVEWAPIIIEMLSRKLDKLCIRSIHYPKYLSQDDANILKKKLPELGKTIFFDATCSEDIEFPEHTTNEHLVKVQSDDHWHGYRNSFDSDQYEEEYTIMIVKHTSRLDEERDPVVY
ncbi:hypothetical protein PMAYCL1PPCAC_08593, partial [Pristionchus mayeri]